MLGEVPVVAIRTNGAIRVLADRCSHMSGPLSDGELADGCLICPWHGTVFRVDDGSVARSRKISVLVSGGAPAGTRTTAGRTCR
jgi:nitrite reductase/ring-hydroxylating ferredoxin subunit